MSRQLPASPRSARLVIRLSALFRVVAVWLAIAATVPNGVVVTVVSAQSNGPQRQSLLAKYGPMVGASVLAVAILSGGGVLPSAQPPQGVPMYATVSDIPNESFKRRDVLEGRIVKIVDGDTYRFRMSDQQKPLWPSWLPSWPFSSSGPGDSSRSSRPNNKRTKWTKANTITVRIAGVDTPETAKGGKAGQALGDEATNVATSLLFEQDVSVKLLAKDRYGRVLGVVRYGPEQKDIAEELLRRGLAVVYRQGGAQYDSR
jgi:endonuclease YncB( thermonuclease family)